MSDALLLDLLDPQSRLVAVDKGSGSLVEDLRDDCGGIIQGLDWIVRKFTSYDLIAMIFDPISGDFAGVEALQDVWRAASAAMGDVAGNYGALSQALPSVWEGDAAASAAHRILRMGQGFDVQREVMELGAACLECILNAVEACCQALASLLSLIDDLALKLVAGGVGWLKEVASGGDTIRKIIRYIEDAIGLIRGLDQLIPEVIGKLAEISGALKIIEAVFAGLAAATNAGPGRDIDDVTGTL
ncbi:hypothetical protein [Nocardioides sp.]|uniref:hypothetical protein n=1 Tax=Nocardioides sp. TaxID=35761 RepID=UPI003516D845